MNLQNTFWLHNKAQEALRTPNAPRDWVRLTSGHYPYTLFKTDAGSFFHSLFGTNQTELSPEGKKSHSPGRSEAEA